MSALRAAGLLFLAFAATAALTATADSTKPAATSNKAATSDADLIRSAMSAAPAAVSKNATIAVMEANGKMRTLRKGTNGFTCVPDEPATPGPDPMCLDGAAMEWLHALIAHKPPPAGKVGLMYMLAGGSDPSNTDPNAEKPAAGSHWIKTGPHIMIAGADQSFYDQYPKGADPDTSVPYVMWAGTPYQHLMAPTQ